MILRLTRIIHKNDMNDKDDIMRLTIKMISMIK